MKNGPIIRLHNIPAQTLIFWVLCAMLINPVKILTSPIPHAMLIDQSAYFKGCFSEKQIHHKSWLFSATSCTIVSRYSGLPPWSSPISSSTLFCRKDSNGLLGFGQQTYRTHFNLLWRYEGFLQNPELLETSRGLFPDQSSYFTKTVYLKRSTVLKSEDHEIGGRSWNVSLNEFSTLLTIVVCCQMHSSWEQLSLGVPLTPLFIKRSNSKGHCEK